MSPRLDSLVVLVRPHDTLAETVLRMAGDKVAFFGLAIVLDDNGRVQGVVNNGDILRLLAAGRDFSEPVSAAMVRDPIAVRPRMTPDEIITDVYRQIRTTRRLTREGVAYVLVTSDDGKLAGVINFADLVARHGVRSERVAIYGMGYVGLTLAAALANRNHQVIGVDISEATVGQLRDSRVHVHEPGLEDMVRASLGRGTLQFSTDAGELHHGVSIIAVGTPVDGAGKADLSALESVARVIGPRLRRGDIVMLRSTVPVGTTREFIGPLLEKLSGLAAGEDFHIAFTPERTVEGKAMRELRELPQVVGGLTAACSQRAAMFWSSLSNSVVHMDSLEAAELVKLANNSFRDLSFGFSNGLAMLADRYNIDAFRLILAANEGYPRNPIPLPSPGVGGYCLTKDPFLYAAVAPQNVHAALATAGRDANRSAAKYPVEILRRYAERHGRKLGDFNVLVVGLAFKGLPETNDLRGSTGIEVAKALKGEGARVCGWDAIVPAEAIAEKGIAPIDVLEALGNVDAVVIMNNHPQNIPPGFLARTRKPMIIFDGWSQLDARDIEQHRGLTYATMGYMTPAA